MGISCPLKQSPSGDGIHGAQGAGAAGTRDGFPQHPPVLWASHSPAMRPGGEQLQLCHESVPFPNLSRILGPTEGL